MLNLETRGNKGLTATRTSIMTDRPERVFVAVASLRRDFGRFTSSGENFGEFEGVILNFRRKKEQLQVNCWLKVPT